jgi:hypothetical protein
MAPELPYEVYLVDPGVRASHVITLLQEITGRSTPECAEMVHDTPVHIAGFSSRRGAEDLVARFREFDAVAIIRRPGEKGAPEPPPPSVVPQPRFLVGAGMLVLGVLQVGLGIWWLLPSPNAQGRHVLLGIGGLVLGLVAAVAGYWKLTHTDLD